MAVGGGVGALLRHVSAEVIGAGSSGIPWSTLTVNVIGSLVLGVVLAHHESGRAAGWSRPLLAVGLCGGLTTFSAFVVEVDRLWWARSADVAISYLIVTVGVCVAAVVVGRHAMRRSRSAVR
ncbi:MAG TPA: fluoride efflux transporter CrcB [Acidimicrobiales bacterium]